MTKPDRERRRDRDPRKRLDEIFGEVLPETTSDERDLDETERARDSWYEENRPPHYE